MGEDNKLKLYNIIFPCEIGIVTLPQYFCLTISFSGIFCPSDFLMIEIIHNHGFVHVQHHVEHMEMGIPLLKALCGCHAG